MGKLLSVQANEELHGERRQDAHNALRVALLDGLLGAKASAGHDGGRPRETVELPPIDATSAPVTRLGDLWVLGEHRLLCGDALQVESFARVLGTEQAAMVFADPPYNVAIDGHASGLGAVKHADFAMALQLQEEEQARQESVNARRRSAQSRNPNAGAPPSSIPIRLRPADAGPAVPPRNQRSNPGVNRPSSNTPDDDAPPLYEEAVKGAPYIPPPGHPQHPASDPSPRASTSAITTAMSAPTGAPRPAPQRAPAQPPRVAQQHGRMSTHQDAQQHGRVDPDRPLTHNAATGLQGQAAGRKAQRDQDKDCVVM